MQTADCLEIVGQTRLVAEAGTRLGLGFDGKERPTGWTVDHVCESRGKFFLWVCPIEDS